MPTPSTIPQRQVAAIVAERVNRMRRDITDARAALATLDRALAPAIIALETRNDGWPSRRGEGGGSGGISDPVATAVVANHMLEPNDQVKYLWSPTMAGMVTLASLIRQMAEMAPQIAAEATKASLCSVALGMPGVDSWGTYDGDVLRRCTDLVHADGLCVKHYTARRRWVDAEKAGRRYTARGSKAS